MFIGTTLAHDAAVAYADVVERRIRFFEMDRFIKVPHFGYLGDAVDAWPKVDRVIRDVPRANVCKAWLFITERLGLTPSRVGFTPVETFSNEYPRALNELMLAAGKQVQLLDHQLSHALEVTWRAGLRDGTVVSLDGVGDGCGAVFTVDHDGRLAEVHRRRAASLGELYEYLTRFFLNEGRPCFGREGSFMAFAGLGKPVPIETGWRAMYARFAEFNLPWAGDEARNVVYAWLAKACGQFDRVDVANTCQRLWVDAALEYICTWASADKPLAFTGGCALNCLLNAELARRWRGDVHWTPTPGDMGQAIGQVLQHLLDRGEDVDAYRLTTVGVYDPRVLSLVSQRLVEVDLDELVVRLMAGQVVAVCRGRVEDGPRALGRRSLLASPLTKGMHDRLNALKGREWFRPYGVVLPREHLADLTDLDVDVPWMNVVVNPPAGMLPEAEHVDGSTRVQTVTAEADPWLHDLLTRFGRATGVYALINTSLNTHGRPIFNHYADMLPLVGHGVDILVVDDLMLADGEVGH